MSAKARIKLQLPSEKQLTTLLDGLEPETNAYHTNRARVSIDKDGTSLVLNVEARDSVALRSTLNAYLRWIDSTLKVLEIVESS